MIALSGLFRHRTVAILLACGALAGCSDYLDRRETVLLGAGNAVQTNIAMHQIDPWPRAARNRQQTTSGERTQHAIERYRNPRATANSANTDTARPAETGTTPRP